jgi:glycogen debranching enzyme
VALVHLQPRPTARYVSRGRTVLATSLDGQVRPERDIGLFVRETRLLSRYEYRIDDQPLEMSALSNLEQHTWLGYYFIRAPGARPRDRDSGSGMVPLATEETLELRVQRRVGEGLHEDLYLTNFSRSQGRFTLAVVIDSDFADYVESGGDRHQHGRSEILWDAEKRRLTLRYAASSTGRQATGRFSCSLAVQVNDCQGSADWDGGALRFPVELLPGQSAAVCLAFIPAFEGSTLEAPVGCGAEGHTPTFDARTVAFLESAAQIDDDRRSTDPANVFAALGQARSDLAALRLFDLDEGQRAWVPAAGVPVYVALFGRDTLTAAWQSALLGPEMMQGALLELARWVGKTDDPWRDEQPGKLLHEAHTGPAAALHMNPRARYYGSITTSGFYAAVLSELWHWTGERTLIEPLLPIALGGLDWLNRDGDINADGFFEYLTRSSQGVKHQAWKDSRDAMVDERGEEIEPPVATCEEQAFVYVAKLQLAEVCWWLDQKDTARRLWREAHDLKARFNERFWMESDQFFAMGLGPEGRQIRAISSNPGHCLAAGIVEEQHVAATADRLMADDLFSGWGIRTLSSQNPAYNP